MTSILLPPIVQEWLTFLHTRGKSEHTIAAYRRAMQHFIQWYEKMYATTFDPAFVMPRDIRDWKGYQQSTKGAKPTTVNQRLVAVSRFFRYARQQNACQENPAEEIEHLHPPQRQPKALKDIEVRRLLRAARANPRDYALLELMIGTGLRVGEVMALRVGDLEMNERSGKVTVRQGKRGEYREVPLTADVRSAVRHYLNNTHPDHENKQAPLWLGPKGELKHRSSILRLLNKYAEQVELPHLNPHLLRHTFATRYLAANRDDLRGLAKLLGHRSLDTVMIYTEPDFDDLIERMERVEHQPPGSGR